MRALVFHTLVKMQRKKTYRDWFYGFLLIGIILIVYARVWHAGFIWDDEAHLTQNPCIVGPLGLKDIWTSTRAVYYPLVLTSFWTLHKFVGLNPSPYHILNVLLHAGSAVLLWRILRQLDVRGGVVGSSALGIASGNGAVGRLGDGVKKYSVVPVLSLIDLLVFESGRGGNRRPDVLVAL